MFNLFVRCMHHASATGHGGGGDRGGPGDASEVRAHHAAQAPAGRAAHVAAQPGAEGAAAAAPGGGATATEEQRGRPIMGPCFMSHEIHEIHEMSMIFLGQNISGKILSESV